MDLVCKMVRIDPSHLYGEILSTFGNNLSATSLFRQQNRVAEDIRLYTTLYGEYNVLRDI